ncbi:TIGR03364 family FAD-dependent oxidoreductase [Brachybacterium sp. YJGR34]|uniref:TIGR03364 family FAD-dependent oxidoreductase n=1 Tax=Brachybacterium sp. YJGR34 TaxID=2059911 RepID=UPI000E0A80E4|nr:TIGR03364 family FAD-dependent oxidoreductase [Brachybacterium sp. YJGR34]
MTTDTDLLVVGGGILGLAVADRALRQGLDVHLVEEDHRPVGSSIQNFGHLCITGQADDHLDLALSSRAGWLRGGAESGLRVARPGTLVPAASPAELRVLEEFAAHRGPEQVRMLTPAQTRDALGADRQDLLGGAHLPLDLRVDPRRAAPRLTAHLQHKGLRVHHGERVLSTAEGAVTTTRATYRAERVVACPGTGIDGLFPEIADRHRITRCTLAMALVERPAHLGADTAILSGTSLARYDGFAAVPGAEELRRDLADREPELLACDANLMVTGIDRGLLVGDSHARHDSPEPFLDARVSSLLLTKASALLGIPEPRVIERWQGCYSDAPDTHLVLEQPDPATTVAVVTSGIGMTLAFGIAERILAGALLT